jgi:ferredoxin
MSYSFAQYQLVRETLWAAQDLGRWLEHKGERSFPVADLTRSSYPTLGPYAETKPHGIPDIRANSPFAATAGLGTLGLHGMLLTPEFGPRQRFSFLLTTAELESTPYQGPDLCLQCAKCVASCPVQALSKDRTDDVAVDDRVYTCSYRQEVRCRWARSLGMVPEEGPACLGWKDPGLPVPDSLTEDEVQEAIRHKDPLQVVAYRYPFQTDVIIEQCLKACPVGKSLG